MLTSDVSDYGIKAAIGMSVGLGMFATTLGVVILWECILSYKRRLQEEHLKFIMSTKRRHRQSSILTDIASDRRRSSIFDMISVSRRRSSATPSSLSRTLTNVSRKASSVAFQHNGHAGSVDPSNIRKEQSGQFLNVGAMSNSLQSMASSRWPDKITHSHLCCVYETPIFETDKLIHFGLITELPWCKPTKLSTIIQLKNSVRYK